MVLLRHALAVSQSILWLAVFLLAPRTEAQEIHSQQCLLGCPYGSPQSNDLLIRDIYILSSNDATKLADWVAYRVDPQNFGKSRKRQWRADPWLAADETLERGDYRQAHSLAGYDRGHQAPLGSFSASRFWYQTNFLSNITPQRSALNQGPWRVLEERIRKLARREVRGGNGVLYVMTGPIYAKPQKSPALPASEAQRFKDKLQADPFGTVAKVTAAATTRAWWGQLMASLLPVSWRKESLGSSGQPRPLPSADEDHKVPSHYWKVIGVQGWPTIRMAAFIMPQTAGRRDDICRYGVPLAEVERATGLTFYHRLGTVEKSLLAARRGKLLAALGCSG